MPVTYRMKSEIASKMETKVLAFDQLIKSDHHHDHW
jgi:hypothetical protein